MQNYIKLAVLIGILATVVPMIYDAVKMYFSTTGTWWEKTIAAGRGSATIAWNRFVALCAAAAGILADGADYLNDPNLSAAIKAALQPQYVAGFVVLVTVITIWARKRTLPAK